MKPKVERHQARILDAMAGELRCLPDHPILTADYHQAREMMRDQISLAMKYSMWATTWTSRAEKPEATFKRPELDVAVCRKEAAIAWWGFRNAIRRARFYEATARIFLELDQEHITT